MSEKLKYTTDKDTPCAACSGLILKGALCYKYGDWKGDEPHLWQHLWHLDNADLERTGAPAMTPDPDALRRLVEIRERRAALKATVLAIDDHIVNAGDTPGKHHVYDFYEDDPPLIGNFATAEDARFFACAPADIEFLLQRIAELESLLPVEAAAPSPQAKPEPLDMSDVRYIADYALGSDLMSVESAATRVTAALDDPRYAPCVCDLVTCCLSDPNYVVHRQRLDCRHEAPHLIAACGAFKAFKPPSAVPAAREEKP